MALAWTIEGIGKTYRLAAEDAAARAGLALGQWLDKVILSHPAGPTRSDADAEITRALEALESRIEERGAKLDEIIKPLNEQLNRLEEESKALRHGHSDAESSAAREIERHIARMDALRESRPEADGAPAEDAPETAATVPPRSRAHDTRPIPDLGGLRRHKLLRLAAGTGAMVMIIGSGGLGIWLWNAHEKLPLAQSAPVAVPAPPGQSPDQTPPPIIAAINAPPAPETSAAKTPAEINALRNRAQDPTRDPGHTAAYELGMALLKGKAGIASLREAGEWIATAALAGHGGAQLTLGRLYASGEGYARDPQQAFFWISAAAEQGITEAIYELGMMYSRGDGVERSHALAAQWFRKAGEQKHAGALYQLGLIYELGLDYRANPRRALEWYRKAAAAGSKAAAEKVRALESRGTIASAPAPAPAPGPAAPPAAATLSRAEVAELQRLLESLALYPGPANGVPGARTIDAVKLYQQMAGLKADGVLNRKLLEQIREVAGRAGAPR